MKTRFGDIETYIAYCCREWVAPVGYPPGRCGLCGEKPTYLREDDYGQPEQEAQGVPVAARGRGLVRAAWLALRRKHWRR